MVIDIKYNEIEDQFANDLTLEMRLSKYINNHFYPAYTISSLAPIYLLGGSIRDLILAKEPNDLDFIVLGKEHLDWVLKVLKKYNIEYKLNKLGGYKFNYEGTKIDLWFNDDLFSAIQYNVDGLFFDLRTNSLLSLTFDDFINNGLREVNQNNNIENGREKKLIIFQKEYLNKIK